MPKNSLLDAEFEDDLEGDFQGDDTVEAPEVEPLKGNPEGKDQGNTLDIEIVDDTPDADKGKRVAKDDDPDDDEQDVRDYGKRVQRRIAQETAKVHAERRRADERERQLQEAVQHIQRLTKDKNTLLTTIESGEKVLVGEHKGRLQGMLEQAKAKYREAHEAGDINAMLQAQEQMSRAAAAMERAESHVSQPLAREDEELHAKIVQARQAQPQVDPRAVEWAERNKWWGKDEGMTSYAMAYHKRLVAEGVGTDGPEYYKAIDTEMRKRFPEKFTAEKPRRSGAVVAAPTRTASSGSPRKVTLTESQVRLAKRLGLTNEQYARQMLAQGDGNEYTHKPRA